MKFSRQVSRFLLFSLVISSGCTQKNNKITWPSLPFAPKSTYSLDYQAHDADKQIDDFFKTLHQHNGFNGNVLVAKNGHIIYENAIGWADYLRRDSLHIDSRFQLASVSKPFTATAILMLAERHKLNIDDDVRKYLPLFPDTGITIRMLLTHTSGLNNYQYFCEKYCDRKTPLTNDDVVAMFAKYTPRPYNKPGKAFFYCNTNFMLLGSVIEKVSGKPYGQFMHDEIFAPLGMKNTTVFSKALSPKPPTKVWGYDRTWRYSVVPNYLDGVIGDKGIYSTVTDLYIFDQALDAGKLLSAKTIAEAYQPEAGQPKHHKHFNYGFGWRLFEEDNGHIIVYHTGWWHGFQNIFVRDMDSKVTIVILSNLRNGSISHLDDLYKIVGMPIIRKGVYND